MPYASVDSILSAFLHAFSRMDVDAMLTCFDARATAFFPTEYGRTRIEGAAAIHRAFDSVVAAVREKGTVLRLDAQDLFVQEFGDTAIATFHIRGKHLARRTLVLRFRDGEWRIVHLHASNAMGEENTRED